MIPTAVGMTRPHIVIGGGGHAKVVVAALQRAGIECSAVLDPDRVGGDVLGVPVTGGDERLAELPPHAVLLVNGIGTTVNSDLRRRVFERMKGQGYTFATVVDPTAVVAPDAELGEGAQVLAGAVVQPGCRIGANALVNTRAAVDHDGVLGDHVHVAPGATLCGSVAVGAGVHVGAGAVVVESVTIGEGTLVGAGAAVIADVPAGSTVLGVPARPPVR